MITTKGLQVGNWLQYKRDGRLHYFQIDAYAFTPLERGDVKHWECVPLSEDILLKAGFEKVDSKEELGDNIWQLAELELWESDLTIRGFEASVVEYKYLHQLQNLYFALTNEELTLTL